MKTILKITGGLLAGLIALGTIAALLAPAESSSSPEPKPTAAESTKAQAAPAKPKAKPKKKRVGAITFKQYRRVQAGMSTSEVRSILGKAKDIDYSEMDLGLGSVTKTQMWSYDNAGKDRWELGGFMLTFTDGKLDSKTSI